MANYERGSTDHDDVPVFDGGEDDDGTDGSHLPVVIVISILVLAAFGGVVWLAYNQGVARGRSDVPARVAMQETASGEGQTSGSQLKVYQQPATADEDFSQTASARPSQTMQAQPTAAKSETRPVQPADSKPAATHVATAARTEAPPALAPAKPKPVPEVSSVATAPPAQLSLSNSKPTTTKPAAAKPVEKPAAVAAKPVAVTTAKPATTAPAGGAYALQIGAYKSQDEAMAAWRAYQTKHTALLFGLKPDVQTADLGAKGTWYRLRVGSFADKTEAARLCDRLKAEDGACFLAR